MSKCFGDFSDLFENDVPAKEASDKQWFVAFKTTEQYVDEKIRMLTEDMYIKPTKEEIEHLYSLTNSVAIDNAVKSLIDRHWSRDW